MVPELRERPSPHGEGGLKHLQPQGRGHADRPSPHGEGGLKRVKLKKLTIGYSSLPTRGGWIETTRWTAHPPLTARPSPHGEGGLKRLLGPGYVVTHPVPPHTGRVD